MQDDLPISRIVAPLATRLSSERTVIADKTDTNQEKNGNEHLKLE